MVRFTKLKLCYVEDMGLKITNSVPLLPSHRYTDGCLCGRRTERFQEDEDRQGRRKALLVGGDSLPPPESRQTHDSLAMRNASIVLYKGNFDILMYV